MQSPTVWLDRIAVLVVDDEQALRCYLSRILRDAGYHVLTASDGIHALSTLRLSRLPVQLVITDVCMPRMSGPELAARLATMPLAPGILFVSGGHDYPDLPAPLLNKPFLANDLIRLVGGMIQERRKAAAAAQRACAGPPLPWMDPVVRTDLSLAVGE